MPSPTVGDLNVSAPLTNVLVASLQGLDKFIADKVFPMVPVQLAGGKYYKIAPGSLTRSAAAKRGLSQEAAGGSYDVSTDTYFCEAYAEKIMIDEQIKANAANPFDPERAAAEILAVKMAIKKEKLWTSTFFTTSKWTGSTSGSDITPGTLWSVDGSTPIADIRAQILSCEKKSGGFRPNTFVLSRPVWGILQDHPDFLDRVTIAKDRIVQPDLLASVLELDRVFIAGAVENTAQQGAADSLDFIAGKNAMLAYVAPSPSIMMPSAGYTFYWDGLAGGVNGSRVRRYYEENKTSTVVEGEMYFDQKLVAAECGVFFSAVIA
ncbi:MAG: hypothetical protein PHE55_08840 [Methylococcaceae bacterium]|nr:hypothetical protein [Methylococcaceae bacterium]